MDWSVSDTLVYWRIYASLCLNEFLCGLMNDNDMQIFPLLIKYTLWPSCVNVLVNFNPVFTVKMIILKMTFLNLVQNFFHGLLN